MIYLPEKPEDLPRAFRDRELMAKHAVQVFVEIIDAIDPRDDRCLKKSYPEET